MSFLLHARMWTGICQMYIYSRLSTILLGWRCPILPWNGMKFLPEFHLLTLAFDNRTKGVDFAGNTPSVSSRSLSPWVCVTSLRTSSVRQREELTSESLSLTILEDDSIEILSRFGELLRESNNWCLSGILKFDSTWLSLYSGEASNTGNPRSLMLPTELGHTSLCCVPNSNQDFDRNLSIQTLNIRWSESA